MATYTFKLRMYHSVKSANIDLNGITVLTGENGSGKSTITRWIHHIVRCISNFEDYALKDFQDEFCSILRQLDIVRRELFVANHSATIVDSPSPIKLIDKIQTNNTSLELETLRLQYNDIVTQMANLLEESFDRINDIRKRRLLSFLDLDTNQPFDKNLFLQKFIDKGNSCYDNYYKVCQSRNKRTLYRYFKYYDDGIDIPANMLFLEDKVNVFEGNSIGYLLNIQQAIYIDTPMVLCRGNANNMLWKEFRNLILCNGENNLSRETKKMIKRIQTIIHGIIALDSDRMDDELRFIRDDKLNVAIEETATGLKSFAYILRLLENGMLNAETLLIIDEPEVHLHPQWIVEFARILVLLHKEIGVRILLASHNPDMVAALQSIAQKEQVSQDMTFYIAEKAVENAYLYNYVNLGQDISEIFKSFNIALERIQDYGAVGNN